MSDPHTSSLSPAASGLARLGARAAPLVCLLLQPLLERIVGRIASRHPELFDRLGEHCTTDYVIDPLDLPFALHLRPDPRALVLRAVPRDRQPAAGAAIRGRFLLLLQLVDADGDGDAAFFSRDLTITGSTEAVVRLRNALDDMEGSLAGETAAMFGPAGRAVLAQLRRRYEDQAGGIAA
ncbi:ubiquinone anaerobic biosynthesis accessory factor UbiT [Stappia sp.]|uniref:ubiquinone anaerobic biosynthesis accessory factor UbiT n=1 Tax=Stappia sp. TaxID=1870903 RepID=UPI003D11B59E